MTPPPPHDAPPGGPAPEAPHAPPVAAASPPRLLRCNIGPWGRTWRILVGGALALASCGAIVAEPRAPLVAAGLAGIFAGSFMIFEGTFSWCILRSAARARGG